MVSSALVAGNARKTAPRLFTLLSFLYHLLVGPVAFFLPERWRWVDISGQTVLITGGSRGLGQLMALRFLKLGCKVVIWGRDAGRLRDTVRRAMDEGLGQEDQLLPMAVDLTDRGAIYAAAEALQSNAHFGPVDILVNNAGVLAGDLLLDSDDEAIERTMAVNTMAHFTTIKAFLPEMIRQGKSIRMTDYCASKWAANGLHESVKVELALARLDDRIHMTLIKPWLISTGMFRGVTSALVTLLRPEYVADRIVSAVRARTPVVVLPAYMILLATMIQFISDRCYMAIFDFYGGFEAMLGYTGRSAEDLKVRSTKEDGAEKEEAKISDTSKGGQV
ncbi:hypothetical protein TYRP_005154 [Tyrophagus putrescentiae]|nr:hypothetical protein TYRP_005154 [Tyrophagus putrescentiae]